MEVDGLLMCAAGGSSYMLVLSNERPTLIMSLGFGCIGGR